MSRLAKIVEGFSEKRIVVIGDAIADQFIYGEISRVSREAPVFILRHEHTETTPGGAGNEATVMLEPATRGMTVTNTVRTVAGSGVRVSSRRVSDDKVIVSGTIGSRAGQRRYQLVVGDPDDLVHFDWLKHWTPRL